MNYRDCPDSPAHGHHHQPGECTWCGKQVSGRRRTWCSDDCVHAALSRHDWNSAKTAALKRDGRRCTTCGRSPADLAVVLHLLGQNAPRWWWGGHGATIRVQRPIRLASHVAEALGRPDPTAADRLLVDTITAAALDVRLEVNHIDPRRGGGYGPGCWNHLDNLETLCHRCHLDVTAEQLRQQAVETVGRLARQAADRAGQARLDLDGAA